MSFKSQPISPVPSETAQVARSAFPDGNVYMKMRDVFGPVYEDALFADLFPVRGQPAACPWRLALITIMQFVEDLTDRQAADAVRARIDWKYALSLPLADAGFDFTVLSQFRTRLIQGRAEHRLFETMLDTFKAKGLIGAGGHQRTDSTHVLSAVRSLNRIELAAETLRHALESLSVIAPTWLRVFVPSDWFERYGQPFYNDRLPGDEAQRLSFVSQVAQDGHALLACIDTDPELSWLRRVPALFTLRFVWIQQFYDDGHTIHWRDENDLAPSSGRIGSPYDPQSRSAKKRETRWFGYKVHVSETCNQDTPHLFTNVETRPAPEQDYLAIEPIHQRLKDRGLLPDTHLVDSAYMSAIQLCRSREQFGIDLLGPAMPDTSWQASEPDAFDLTYFHIDWQAEKVTCPQGKQSRYWRHQTDRYDQPIIHIFFDRRACAACSVRSKCTRSATGGRSMTLKPEKEHLALQKARERQKTADFRSLYKKRAGVEGTISESVNALGMRRARYLGQTKTHLQILATATAINLKRAVAWIMEQPRAATRTSRFAALAA